LLGIACLTLGEVQVRHGRLAVVVLVPPPPVEARPGIVALGLGVNTRQGKAPDGGG